MALDGNAGPELRFPGLSLAARAFFQAVDREPCPTSWPGADRVAYARHVLGPLKALVGDLHRLLADAAPALSLEARVGASLAWPRHVAPDSADCPVRTLRAWTTDSTPSRSSLLSVNFSGRAIEISLEAAGGDPEASRRLRDALLGPDEDARADAASLLCAGWQVDGADVAEVEPPDAEDPLPEHLRPWFAARSVRVFRPVAWEPWIEEPGFALEVADRWRELLPFFEIMRAESAPELTPTDVGRS